MDGGDQRSIQLNPSCNVMQCTVYRSTHGPSVPAKRKQRSEGRTRTYVISRKPPRPDVLMLTAEA